MVLSITHKILPPHYVKLYYIQLLKLNIVISSWVKEVHLALASLLSKYMGKVS